MKRYNYSKWFKKIMNRIPIKFVRVLVLMVLIVWFWIQSLIVDILKHFKNVPFSLYKEVIGDVWHWEERGDSLNGKINRS